MAPLRDHRRVGSATCDVSADSHRSKRAAVIALPARNNTIAPGLLAFEKILPRELDCGFRGLGTAGSKIDAAAVLKISWRKSQNARCKFFRRIRVKLRCVRKRDLAGLRGHCAADFLNAVSDADHSRLAGSVEIAAAYRIKNPAAFASHSDRILLTKIPREKRCRRRGRAHIRIVTEGPEGHGSARLVCSAKLACQPAML